MRIKIPGDYGAGGLILDEAFTRDQALMVSPGQFHCWVKPDGSVTARKADPVVWVTGQLLSALHAGQAHPSVSLRCQAVAAARRGGFIPFCKSVGDVIRVETAERAYVYVVSRLVSDEHRVWEARWPD